MNKKEVTPVRATIYRGGTSKGIFLHENDLPQDPKIRDKVILAIFGSPDPRQIDGLGGAEVLTSKLAIVALPAFRCGCRLHVRPGKYYIALHLLLGLCGNISSGVAPFALKKVWFAPLNR
jgi:2-methylaconitate cis-trans-isomerase PrpF